MRLLILVLICALFVGCHKETRDQAVARKSCIGNLRMIYAAEQEWALENKKTTNDVPTWADLEGHYLRSSPICPAGGTYTLGRIDENPKCSVSGHALP